ncbi:hypothetical protein [Nonlabens marinus]|uniref:Uncharacterized protein n=1 Tax=Nonlabens marinus S1-08 TaxID=1454201 RepID=W8W0Q1_9FLAO|nr:hypothetical protein [Nonlabens marinus]BAO56716.1 hypothetical protein NMS_2707 [Nonlabens marinus S1-08]
MKNILYIVCALMTLVACKADLEKEVSENNDLAIDNTLSDAEKFVEKIETAHHKGAFLQQEVVSFDIDLNFGGQDRLDATVFISTDSRFVRIEKNNGEVLLYDGTNVWLAPQSASQNGARFDVFTWSYFFSLPYKLTDPGTQITLKNQDAVNEHLRLSFEAGTGDAPDDWYDLYTYADTNLLHYAGYIVTYGGTPVDQAAENAHAIAYEDYKEVNGIPIAHTWKFYNYGESVDTTQVIGEAKLSNLRFSAMDSSLFQKPSDASQIQL